MNSNLTSTKNISTMAEYFDTPSSFFENFSSAWESVSCQVLKIESRQTYIEPGNKSYEQMKSGNMDAAIAMIPIVRSSDHELYSNLKDRGVDFVRCRPLTLPLSEYMKWEIECYKYNIRYGERIFITDKKEFQGLFSNLVLHDFMVFDRNIAFIHDYNFLGEIQGGWLIQNQSHIDQLICLFGLIKSVSMEFNYYISSVADL